MGVVEGERVGTEFPHFFLSTKNLEKYSFSALIEGRVRWAFPHFQIQHYNTDHITSCISFLTLASPFGYMLGQWF